MAGLQHIREGAKGDPAQQPRGMPSDTSRGRPIRSQPLGVVLFCRRKGLNGEAGGRNLRDETQTAALKAIAELERRAKSRVYRVYACEDGPEGKWEYFTVLEFGDLQAWNVFEQDLEKNGFGALFDWEVRAFGRGLG
jgi:hypothetical protein